MARDRTDAGGGPHGPVTPGAPESTRRACPTTTLGDVDNATQQALTSALARAYEDFDLYRTRLHEAGLTGKGIPYSNALEVLQQLPVLDATDLPLLFNQSLDANWDIIDLEASSGTTGIRKRRPITYDDSELETRLLARAFDICGVTPADRVACLDTGPLTLMASFTEALEHIGVAEAYAFTVSPNSGSTVDVLAELDPTVIMTVPSVLERVLGALLRRLESERLSLRALAYAGEPLATSTRTTLESVGLEVFSYYGSSETSTLGIECRSHVGVHLFTDMAIIECDPDADGVAREIVVTTLHQQGLPLLRYPLRDRVKVMSGPCPCGLTYPRVEVLGRADHSVSVLGVQLNYHSIRDAIYGGLSSAGLMQATLTGGEMETLVLALPEELAEHEKKIRESLLIHEPDIAFLVGAGFLHLRIEFTDESTWAGPRKANIADQRDAYGGASR